MDVLVYKTLHLLGIFLVFSALGGMIFHVINGGDKDNASPARRLAGMGHGIGLILLLVSGFGMLAKLNLGFEPWVFAKLALWLVFGMFTAAVWRKPAWAPMLWWALPVLGGVAAWLALYKPF